jgi:hypothetical protein
VLLKYLNRDHLLKAKNVELKIQRLVDRYQSPGIEDDHLSNERQSPETVPVRQLRKLRQLEKIKRQCQTT